MQSLKFKGLEHDVAQVLLVDSDRSNLERNRGLRMSNRCVTKRARTPASCLAWVQRHSPHDCGGARWRRQAPHLLSILLSRISNIRRRGSCAGVEPYVEAVSQSW